MKPIFLAFLLISGPMASLRGSDDALSAQELAHHLGVSSWVSNIRLQGADWVLQVFHVVDGKVADPLLGSPAFATDREPARIAILASQTPAGTQLSIRIPGAPAVRHQVARLPLKVTIPLPPMIAEGDYLLGGDLPISNDQPSPSLRDLKNGLLLRVARRP